MEKFWVACAEHRKGLGPMPHLGKYLIRQYLPSILKMALLRAVSLVITLWIPFVMLPQVLQYLNPVPGGPDLVIDSGVALAFILCGLQIILSLCSNGCQMMGVDLWTRLTAVGSNAVYEKSFRLSHKSRQAFPPAKIMNLINSDVPKSGAFAMSWTAIWTAPTHIVVCTVLIGLLIRHVVWIPVVLFTILIVVQVPAGEKLGGTVGGYMGSMDGRISVLREFLYGVKGFKFSAFEGRVAKKVAAARLVQTNHAWSFGAILYVLSALEQLQGLIVPVISFAMFSATGGDMSGYIIFPVLSLFNTLQAPFTEITGVMADYGQAIVAVRRIQAFLIAEEVDPAEITLRLPAAAPGKTAIEFETATFEWEDVKGKDLAESSSGFRLSDITFDIPKGSHVAIVGPTPCGKSSLFSSLVGHMRKTGGQATMCGSIAYCPQEPWLSSGTVLDNITIGRSDVSKASVAQAIKLCQLDQDLALLANGVSTEIGEKGVQLSGGQKSRVALARAVAADADIYLLDDPTASLDAHVSKEIFAKVVHGPVLRNKTLLLATHRLETLPKFDRIIVLANGKVTEMGTYDELMVDKNGALARLMDEYEHRNEIEIDTRVDGDGDAVAPVTGDQNKKTGSSNPGQGIVAEERKKGRVTNSDIWVYLKAAGGTVFTAVTVISMLLLVATMSLSSVALAWEDIRLYAVFSAAAAVTFLIMTGFVAYGGWKAGVTLHDIALLGLLRAPLTWFDSQPVGRILSRMSTDVKDVDMNLPNTFSVLLSTGAIVATSVVLIVSSNVMLLALVLLLTIMYSLLFQYYQTSFRELKRLQSITKSPLSAHVSETMTGMSTVSAYGLQSAFVRRQYQRTDDANLANLLYLATRLWFLLRLEILSSSVVLCVILLAPYSPMHTSTAPVSITYALSLSGALIPFFMCLGRADAMFNSVERLNHYAEELPREAPAHLSTDPISGTWPSSGGLAFSELSLAYPNRPDHTVVRSLTASFRPGEKIGCCGRTGSGKSTLASSLFRMMEATSGCVRVDGLDIATLGLDTLRSNLEIVAQEPTLLSGSIRENLDVEGVQSDDAVWKALEDVGLREFVAGLPEMLDAPVLEGASNLSVGQRQLVCLARALLKKSKILIMDEATASVDAETDKRIQELILSPAFRHVTVLAVAHRLSSVSRFSRVMVMDEGRMIECDTPHVLLTRGGAFADMVDALGPSQSRSIREAAKERQRS
ncbi:Multidrug resistance-associated protein 1 [Thoreauomyces humboldtii]|nr:Multidrug resistance-associated protein 1 [Thoreauomyces humboldtii]